MIKYLLVLSLLFCNYHAFAKLPDNLNLNSTCLIMEDQGLSGKPIDSGKIWRHYYENEFGCNSGYKKLKASSPYILENNLALYIIGSATKINKIYLVLNINDKIMGKDALNELSNASSILYNRITKKKLPDDFIKSIQNSKSLKRNIDGYNVEIKRSDWPTNKGYELHFIIN